MAIFHCYVSLPEGTIHLLDGDRPAAKTNAAPHPGAATSPPRGASVLVGVVWGGWTLPIKTPPNKSLDMSKPLKIMKLDADMLFFSYYFVVVLCGIHSL